MKLINSNIFIILSLCFSFSLLSAEELSMEEINKAKKYTVLKERAKQTKLIKKRIDHQKKNGFKNQPDLKKVLHVGSDIEPNWDELTRVDGDTISILINGEKSTIVAQNSGDITVTVTFSDGQNIAELDYALDMNGNGIWEEDIDLSLDFGEMIMDNDGDENPADGIWETTWESDDGPQSYQNLGLFMMVEDGGGSAHAFLYVEPEVTDYSISARWLMKAVILLKCPIL